MAKITVRSVRPAPQGFSAACVCLCCLSVTVGPEDEPIELVRFVKGQGDQPGKEYKRGSIPVGTIRLEDVTIGRWEKNGDRGNYVQVNGFKFERSVQDEIVRQALTMFNAKKSGARVPTDDEQPHQDAPHGPYDPEGDPFETAVAMNAPGSKRGGA